MILEAFTEWETNVRGEILDVKHLLNEEIPAEPEESLACLYKIEAHYQRIGEIHSKAKNYLSQAREELMPRKEEGTLVEREIILESKTSSIQFVCDVLENILNGIKQRLIAIESALSYRKQFPDHQAK